MKRTSLTVGSIFLIKVCLRITESQNCCWQGTLEVIWYQPYSSRTTPSRGPSPTSRQLLEILVLVLSLLGGFPYPMKVSRTGENAVPRQLGKVVLRYSCFQEWEPLASFGGAKAGLGGGCLVRWLCHQLEWIKLPSHSGDAHKTAGMGEICVPLSGNWLANCNWLNWDRLRDTVWDSPRDIWQKPEEFQCLCVTVAYEEGAEETSCTQFGCLYSTLFENSLRPLFL